MSNLKKAFPNLQNIIKQNRKCPKLFWALAPYITKRKYNVSSASKIVWSDSFLNSYILQQ